MTKEEILKKNITGYRGAIKQSDAFKSMQEYADQETLEWRNMVDELRQKLFDIEQKPNDRPAPEGAEEVLKNLFGLSEFRLTYSINECLQAMRTFRDQEVAKAVKAKEAEILEILNIITELQEKYDENGYGCQPLAKLQRIEQNIDASFSNWEGEYRKLEAELTEAKKRIAELEKTIEALKHIGH